MSLSANKYLFLFLSCAITLNGCTTLDIFKQSSEPAVKKETAIMVPANYNAAINAAKSGDTEQAIKLFKDITQKNPKFSNAYTNLGLLYLKDKNTQEAEKAFNTALELDDNDAVAYNHLGIIMREKGKFTDARKLYQKAIDLNPDYTHAYLNLGILLDLYIQDLPEAMVQYKQYQSLTHSEDKQVEKWIIDLEKRIQTTNQPAS